MRTRLICSSARKAHPRIQRCSTSSCTLPTAGTSITSKPPRSPPSRCRPRPRLRLRSTARLELPPDKPASPPPLAASRGQQESNRVIQIEPVEKQEPPSALCRVRGDETPVRGACFFALRSGIATSAASSDRYTVTSFAQIAIWFYNCSINTCNPHHPPPPSLSEHPDPNYLVSATRCISLVFPQPCATRPAIVLAREREIPPTLFPRTDTFQHPPTMAGLFKRVYDWLLRLFW
jgi:hypothetical protein